MVDRHIVCADYLKAIIFREKRFVKDGSLQVFGSWDQKLILDSRITKS